MAADEKKGTEEKKATQAQETAAAIGALANTTVAPPRAASEKRVPVKLLKNYGNNFAGEVCGFPEEIAQQLVEAKAAERVKA